MNVSAFWIFLTQSAKASRTIISGVRVRVSAPALPAAISASISSLTLRARPIAATMEFGCFDQYERLRPSMTLSPAALAVMAHNSETPFGKPSMIAALIKSNDSCVAVDPSDFGLMQSVLTKPKRCMVATIVCCNLSPVTRLREYLLISLATSSLRFGVLCFVTVMIVLQYCETVSSLNQERSSPPDKLFIRNLVWLVLLSGAQSSESLPF